NDTATTEIYPLSLHDALPISRRKAGRLVRSEGNRLDLGFLELDVLAHFRVVLHDLHLVLMELLVLRDRVEVTRVRRGDELHLLAHGLDPLPLAPHLGDDGID